MKKFLSKRTALILGVVAAAMVLSMGVLTGCATEQKEATTDTAASTTSTDVANHDPVELQIFAANSLSKAMDEAQSLYTESHPWVTFADTQYKSSGELNELIAGGAHTDILISASKGKMDDASAKGYIDDATRFDMFTNDLVMVTSADNQDITSVTLEDIASGKYTVAVGDDSVPAGNYAAQALSTVGLYQSADGTVGKDSKGTGGTYTGALAEAGALSLQTSVGNVCKQAQSGDVDIAFVYSSDVYRFGGVKVVGTVPADTHKSIIYPAAVSADATNATEANDFLTWCVEDPEAQQVWQKWGFVLS